MTKEVSTQNQTLKSALYNAFKMLGASNYDVREVLLKVKKSKCFDGKTFEKSVFYKPEFVEITEQIVETSMGWKTTVGTKKGVNIPLLITYKQASINEAKNVFHLKYEPD